MSVQKQFSNSAYAAFCPAAPLIIAGSACNGDAADVPSPVLEVCSIELSKPGLELPRVGSTVDLPAPVLDIAWGTYGIQSGRSKYGMLAGSLADGSVCLWDPTAMIVKASPRPLIHSWKPSAEGKINSISFNPQLPHVLAVGSSQGEVMVYDIASPRQPKDALGEETVSVYAAPPARSGAAVEVLSVDFNNIADRILGIGYSNGSTHVYDFRNKRRVFEVRDENSPRRTSALAWSPVEQTLLVTASEDHRSPTIQLWDLRKGKSPMLEFVGHHRGVTDVAWCPHDVSVLLSTGQDRKTFLWDTRTGDKLGHLPTTSNSAAIQAAWSPTMPGVFLSCQMGGPVSVASYLGTACVEESYNDPATGQVTQHCVSKPLPRAPAFCRPRCAARFGWGGRLAVVQPSTTSADARRVVEVRSVGVEPSLREHSNQFEHAIFGDLRTYCQEKASVEEGEEADYWSFIEVLLEGENSKHAMLSRLGFSSELQAQFAADQTSASAQVEQATAALASVSFPNGADDASAGLGQTQGGSGDDFFDRAGSPTKANADDFFASVTPREAKHSTSNGSDAGMLQGLETDLGGETEVQRALFVGNHSAAVDVCFSHERMADALVLAHLSDDPELWRATLTRYMRHCPQPYMRIVESQMQGDFDALVRARPTGQWMETLAILVTYADADFTRLCRMLAKRLESTNMVHAATLCYICAQDVEAAITLWLQDCREASLPVEKLQRVLEKSIALGKASAHESTTPALADLIANYALQLVSEGCLTSAMTYLQLLPADTAPALAVLADRVFRSAESTFDPAAVSPPMFPFESTDVPVSAEGHAAQQVVYSFAYDQQANYQAQQSYQSTPSTHGTYAPQQPLYQQPSYGSTPNYGAPAPSNANGKHWASSKVPDYRNRVYDPAGEYGAAPSYNQPATPVSPGSMSYRPGATAYDQGAAPPYGAAPSAPAQPYQPQASAPAPAAPYDPSAGSGYASSHTPPAPAYQPSAPVAPFQGQPKAPAPAFVGGPTTAPAPTSAPHAGGPAPHAASSVYNPSMAQQQPGPVPPSGPSSNRFMPTRSQAPHPPGPPGGHPQAPSAPPPPPPPAMEPPADCTLRNVDISKVGPQGQGVIQALTALYQACEPIAHSSPARQRDFDDIAKRLGTLFWKMNAQQLSPAVLSLLEQFSQAINQHNWQAAQHCQVTMTGSHWEEGSAWLAALKRLLKFRQQFQ